MKGIKRDGISPVTQIRSAPVTQIGNLLCGGICNPRHKARSAYHISQDKLIYILLFWLLLSILNANVVINELLYDPPGTDTGYEWLELYNNGNTTIDLESAYIQTAGSEFVTVFTFPHYLLRPGRFVLIGESNLTQAIFITALAMQNGGSETDGVRYLSADGGYTDTVLYDEPNTFQLPDDTGTAGVSWAADVVSGYSLARRTDGYDTDAGGMDFVSQSVLTPGLPNPPTGVADYALVNPQIDISETELLFSTDIVNNSLVYIDTLTITLRVLYAEETIQSFDIQPFPTGSTVPFSTPLNLPEHPAGAVQILLDIYADNNSGDNTWTYWFEQSGQFSSRISELLYNPETGNQEWVELEITGIANTGMLLTLEDAAGNDLSIELPAQLPQYLVLCRDPVALLSRYPDCPTDGILEVSTLPSLNNDGDTLLLKDSTGVMLDSLTYVGNDSKKGYSLERQTAADSTVSWHYCYAAAQGTPGQANSTAPPAPPIPTGSVKLLHSPFNPLDDESMTLQYSFRDESNSLSCVIYDLRGSKRHTLADYQRVGKSGELTWNGRDRSGKALPRGIYIFKVSARDSNGKYFLQKQLTVVLATK